MLRPKPRSSQLISGDTARRRIWWLSERVRDAFKGPRRAAAVNVATLPRPDDDTEWREGNSTAMAEMVDKKQIVLPATSTQIANEAAKIASGFNRKMQYLSQDPLHTLFTTVQEFHGQDETSFSMRPAQPGRTAVTISSSIINGASDYAALLQRAFPDAD